MRPGAEGGTPHNCAYDLTYEQAFSRKGDLFQDLGIRKVLKKVGKSVISVSKKAFQFSF